MAEVLKSCPKSSKIFIKIFIFLNIPISFNLQTEYQIILVVKAYLHDFQITLAGGSNFGLSYDIRIQKWVRLTHHGQNSGEVGLDLIWFIWLKSMY